MTSFPGPDQDVMGPGRACWNTIKVKAYLDINNLYWQVDYCKTKKLEMYL